VGMTSDRKITQIFWSFPQILQKSKEMWLKSKNEIVTIMTVDGSKYTL
jgi:hypothetical protein